MGTDRIGLYCGTFNPFHNGHYNIYQKACKLFDRVVVAAGTNPDKYPTVCEVFVPEGVELITYEHRLTTDLIRQFRISGDNVALIRGIRNGNDYAYEMNQIEVMQDLLPDLQVVLIPCDRRFSHISSTMIRSLYKFDKHVAMNYLPCTGHSLECY